MSLGDPRSFSKVVTVSPTVDTSQYAALDVIGGELTITNAMRVNGGSGVLQAITIVDNDNEKAAFDILIMNAALTGTKADQGAIADNAADRTKFIGRIQVTAADYLSYVASSQAIAQIRNIGLPVESAAASRDLYCVILATGTPTYTATTDLMLKFHFLQD